MIHFPNGATPACLMLLIWLSAGLVAQNDDAPMRVTHVLGLEGLSNNANGNLSIQEKALHFQGHEGRAAQITIGSIQSVFLGEQDKQVGGTPMTLGKVATPFGGGRVISLFSHKKYDTLTMEYLDSNGGLHGVIFQLNKGQGQVLKNKLVAEGAHVAGLQIHAEGSAVKTSAGRNSSPWSVQVDSIDTGDVSIEPAFRIAIYENLMDELAKTKQFKHVFRSGDRNAGGSSGLLILKTTVQNYTPGSETRRAVTTVAGATKLKVRSQLCTREGKVILEKIVDGNVRFFGGNLRATHNLSHNVAGTIKRSPLPEPTQAVTETPE